HGRSSRLAQRLIAAVIGVPQLVVAQSAFARDYIRRAGRPRSLIVLPNWFPGAETLEVMRNGSHAPVFLFIAGSEATRKGVQEVLSAARLLQERGSPARFRVLGLTPALMARIKQLGLSNISAKEGMVAHERVLEGMRQADAFLLPSHGEGF